MNINNKDGWLFPNPQKNEIHILSDDEIEQLFQLAESEDLWAKNVRDEVEYYDKHPGGNYFINKIRTINAPGTVVRYPFNISTITFPSRRHLFRGEPQIYKESVPSFNRKFKKDILCWKAIADMRASQFYKFIWQINVVPYWEAKLSDINIKALAQHYGFDTCLLDLTNDIRVALFFATCVYIPETDSYRPMTDEECNERKYGAIFHTPDWCADYFNGGSSIKIIMKHGMDIKKPLGLDNGDFDEIAFQIGLQPLMRCHHQSGYIYPMYESKPLQDNWRFEKLYVKLSVDLSNRIFDLMDGGKRVFPNEGITEAKELIDKIKNNWIFSDDDLKYAFYEQNQIESFDDFKDIICNFDYNGNKAVIQEKDIEFKIPHELLASINEKYDNKFLLEPTGGMFHTKPEEVEFRKNRCKEIYGKMID